MFGQAPDTPTPPNVSPLLLNSGPSPERTLPTRVLLLSPYGDLRASSRDQLPLPGPSTPMGSAALTISQPVQSGLPLQTTHEWPPANTTHRHQAQSEDIRPDSGGRRLGLRGRLLRVFRVSFRAWLCIPIQPVPGRLEHTPSKSRRSKGEDDNGGDTPSQKTSAGGGHTISTRTQNNINNQVHQIPPSPGSLDAFMGSSSQSDRHGLPVTTSDGAVKEKARTETIIGIPEQRPSADLGLYMPTAQPISLAPNSALPYSDTSAEPPLFTKALYTEPGEQETDSDDDRPDVDCGVYAGHRTDYDTLDFEHPQSLSESDGGGYDGPSQLRIASRHSVSTMSTSSVVI